MSINLEKSNFIRHFEVTPNLKIAYIDDNQFDRQILESAFSFLKIDCRTYCDLQSASLNILSNPPDLLITDWILSYDDINHDPLYPLSFINSQEHLNNLSLIVLSAAMPNSVNNVKVKALMEGVLYWIDKPFNPETLVGVIERIFS